nr:hypothetical protein [Enterobacter hormaechei]
MYFFLVEINSSVQFSSVQFGPWSVMIDNMVIYGVLGIFSYCINYVVYTSQGGKENKFG